MPLTVTGSLADPRAFGEAVERFGRRSVAQKLRQQGERARALGLAYCGELGPSRSGKRRRDKGVSYRNGFEAPLYTGLDDFASGMMQITLKNRSRHARIIEGGSAGHSIDPVNKRLLAWPANNVSGPADIFAKHVDHPGTTGYHILERACRDAMQQGFVGQSVGHAQVVCRVLH
jgi:hypothetical protein